MHARPILFSLLAASALAALASAGCSSSESNTSNTSPGAGEGQGTNPDGPADPGSGSGGGNGSSAPDGGGPPGSGEDAAPPRKVCTGFASNDTAFAVPAPTFNAVNATYGDWQTFDLDGDGVLDLVQAYDPDTSKAFAPGGAHWRFYKGAAAGFASSPAKWSVPALTFNAVNATYGDWQTLDLDGDGKLDLVQAYDPATSKAFASGGPHWRFYKGGANGFASSESKWSVPSTTFNAVNATYGDWQTLDLDGDGKLDLVQAYDPVTSKAFASGGPHWRFYKGGANGFASSETKWAVPSPSFNAVNATYGDWQTFDLDHDGSIDLVRAYDPATSKAFVSSSGAHWEVFRGGAAGFAPTAVMCSVPDASYNAVNATYGDWRTLDLDGDGCMDLVRAYDPATGKAFAGPSWRFFPAK